MINHLKNNITIYLYIFISIILELTTNIIIYHNPLIYKPWFGLTLLLSITFILFMIKKGFVRYVFASIFMIVQGIINLACVIIYDMTGTLFDFSMFTLRNDAMSILEKIPMNFTYLYIFFILFSLYLIFVKDLSKKEIHHNYKFKYIINSLLLLTTVTSNIFLTFSINNKTVDYKDRLYNSGDNYRTYGATSNFINQLYKGLIFNEVEEKESAVIDSFIYDQVSKDSKYFGISKGNNVVTILVESFEWFSFIQDLKNYPNGLNGLTEENIEYLFPNLTKFYNNSVKMVNNYSREKTDISENLSLIGSYPRDVYINYEYPNNTVAYTIPAILESMDSDIQTISFHNNSQTFYNRENSILALGFDEFYGFEDMLKLNSQDDEIIKNYSTSGEANLDSEMIERCKDIMFPTDKRFYTYITTLTMHGMYTERKNLSRWREKIDSINVLTKSDNDNDMKNDFRNYISAVMEFDYALGLIIEDLTNKGLMDNTTIVIFGDHNAYYEGLTNYVKDIYNYDHDNYNNLYRTPLMIYDSNINAQTIDKFTTIYDMVPTILDLLGIRHYSNLYYGNSVFNDEESILYSRAYDIFLTDEVYFSNFKNIYYQTENVDNNYMDMLENKALIVLEKLDYITSIFAYDYFKDEDNYNKFISKMNEINK